MLEFYLEVAWEARSGLPDDRRGDIGTFQLRAYRGNPLALVLARSSDQTRSSPDFSQTDPTDKKPHLLNLTVVLIFPITYAYPDKKMN